MEQAPLIGATDFLEKIQLPGFKAHVFNIAQCVDADAKEPVFVNLPIGLDTISEEVLDVGFNVVLEVSHDCSVQIGRHNAGASDPDYFLADTTITALGGRISNSNDAGTLAWPSTADSVTKRTVAPLQGVNITLTLGSAVTGIIVVWVRTRYRSTTHGSVVRNAL